ncbi:MAG: TVP38/TMEM64 family protein, partial [Elusimicrobiota bacterium]|nr:TVP38/TMEM64 family protein [Elusimicrobiota bacterium]
MAELLRNALENTAALGALGWVAFVLLYAFACVAFLPVSVLTLGAGAVFGVWLGFGLVWIGATVGACVSFLIGRHWLRGWVERKIAHRPLFAAIDAAVSVEGWRIVILTRLTPLFPFAIQNYAYGITRVGFREYAAASFLGMAPGTFMFVSIGAAAGEAVKAGAGETRTPAEWAFYAVGLAAT